MYNKPCLVQQANFSDLIAIIQASEFAFLCFALLWIRLESRRWVIWINSHLLLHYSDFAPFSSFSSLSSFSSFSFLSFLSPRSCSEPIPVKAIQQVYLPESTKRSNGNENFCKLEFISVNSIHVSHTLILVYYRPITVTKYTHGCSIFSFMIAYYRRNVSISHWTIYKENYN